MKARILLLAAGIATLTSCTSLYKTSQTPDDVYFSPARPAPPVSDEYVQNDNSKDGYQSYQAYQDAYRNDRFLRMSIGNPYYLSVYDDFGGFDWRYNAYTYYGSSPWNNYYAWNNYYNPYCVMPIGGYGGYYTKGSYIPTIVSKPVAFNRASYASPSTPRYISNPSGGFYNPGSQSRYSNSNTSYAPANNSSNSNNSYHSNDTYTPTRSYSPSPSSSSSSSSSGSSGGGGGGGGGGISRPTRP